MGHGPVRFEESFCLLGSGMMLRISFCFVLTTNYHRSLQEFWTDQVS